MGQIDRPTVPSKGRRAGGVAKLNGVYSFEASVSPSYAGELARTNLPGQLLLSGINHPPKKQGRQLLRRLSVPP